MPLRRSPFETENPVKPTEDERFFFLAFFAFFLLLMWPAPEPTDKFLPGLPYPCPFLTITRYPCPLCGFSRSLVCAAHGQIVDSLRFHLLGFLPLLLPPLLFLRHVLGRPLTLPRLWWRYVLGAFLFAWLLRLAHLLPALP